MSTSSITPSPPLSLSHAHIIPLEGSPPDKKQDKGKAPASPTTLGDGEDTAIDDESEIEEEELPICSVCLEPFQTRTSVSPCFRKKGIGTSYETASGLLNRIFIYRFLLLSLHMSVGRIIQKVPNL